MKIAVAAATGNVAGAAVQKLVEAGAQVVALVRHPEKLRVKCQVEVGSLEDRAFVMRATQGEDHPATLITMSSLAANHIDLGRPAQAIALYEAVLKKRRAKYGVNHPDTAISMNNLAVLYKLQGKYAQSEPLRYPRDLSRLPRDSAPWLRCAQHSTPGRVPEWPLARRRRSDRARAAPSAPRAGRASLPRCWR